MLDSDGRPSLRALTEAEWEQEDGSPVPIPPRSRVYRLAPIGIGTPDVECLTGYIARLAAAHCMTPYAFLRHAAPEVGSLTAHRKARAAAAPCNGVSDVAGCVAAALEACTGCGDVARTTLRPWRDVLSHRMLVRRRRAWCPRCLHGWSDSGHIVYEPLLWVIDAVAVCRHHGEPLRTACPHVGCGRSSTLLAGWAGPGHCAHCGGWLGSAHPAPAPDGIGDISYAMWAAVAVARLVAATPDLPDLPDERCRRLATEIDTRLQVLGHGCLLPIAQTTGVGMLALQRWRQGACSPMLDQLLRFAHAVGVSSLPALLGGEMSERSEEVDSDGALPPTIARAIEIAAAQRSRIVAMRQALCDALNGPDERLPAVSKYLTHFGYSNAFVLQHAPDLRATIIERRARERERRARERERRARGAARAVAKVTRELATRGAYPSREEVAQALGYNVFVHKSTRRKARGAYRTTMTALGLPWWGGESRRGER